MRVYLFATPVAPLLALGLAVGQPKTAPDVRDPAPPARGARAVDNPAWAREALEQVRKKYNLPSASAALVVDGQVVAASAVGRRRNNSPTPVTRDDRYKIASVSKPVTSTLIGVLVDKGVLGFGDTLEKMFPELAQTMHPGYRKVTVAQLMSHTGGLPYQPTRHESHERFKDLGAAVKNRYEYVKNALADPPEVKPGEKFVYSGGHVIAAHYAERLTKKPVEELLEEHLYRPLGWSAARDHVNVTSGLDKLDGPWPHVLVRGMITPRVPLGEHGKSRLPVGGVCCSMTELGRLAAVHLPPSRTNPAFLKAETRTQLHAPQPPGASSMSWERAGVDWAKGLCLWHNGCDGHWFCLVHILPEEGYATCVSTNYGGDNCDTACQQIHLELVKRVPQIRRQMEVDRAVPPPSR